MNTPKPPPPPQEPQNRGPLFEYITTCQTCGIPIRCNYCARLSPVEQMMLERLRRVATYHSVLISFKRPEQTPDKEG